MRFLPKSDILELAPGYGRCTQYLANLCKNLIVVDLNSNCIEHCKERFNKLSNIEYFTNDGKSLNMIKNNSIDFIFSWDSMVHVEKDTISIYLEQLANKLKQGGMGFIHHSNLADLVNSSRNPASSNPHWRAESMSADLFRFFCEKYDLKCLVQEKINWGGEVLNDCFSLFIKDNYREYPKTKIIENCNYMNFAEMVRHISESYVI
jgi:ubiquinone/menaquinone biosynthesis C-methylase UbiE